ncbi:alpha/beta hydrolase [Streptomyces sp. 1331.2]|uniref:alpha/beta hydrolase n=1 Tax=Streptomyces sp. 1331.2 TaxID=1938835 RepID=UPI000BD218EC|nr:alpha/beta hydrolase [Streptomyces sp. 1331.2]SOB83990.1 Pimeloyl-ACP methyl ester carboxylesterase [Streptomyces sp. 1331.2]
MSQSPLNPEELTVPVPGGDLAVLRWPAEEPGAPTVVAVHGITANSLAWYEVAHRLAGRVTLLAPDLRGRGASRSVAGPYGLVRHADDVAALIAALGSGPAVVAGHSMGAWIAALAALRHPGLVRRVLLVDGALTFPLPAGVPEEDALAAVLGPAVARLSMTFPDREAYRAFWQRHPAVGAAWTDGIDAHTQRDLVGEAPELRSSCVPEAVRIDGAQVLLDREAAAAVHRLTCPAELLWAERGLFDEPQGLYDHQRIGLAGLDPERVPASPVPGTNHYSILWNEAGADRIVRSLLADTPAAG